MSARDDILNAVRRHQPAAIELPPDVDPIRFDDPCATFVESVAAVGGRGVVVADLGELERLLAEQPQYAEATNVCSMVPDVGRERATIDLDAIDDPHDLDAVDYALLPAEFGVAENGAVWMNDTRTKHRVLWFIAQHLGIVLPADAIVHNMHEAYARLQSTATAAGHEHPFPGPGFGLFLSGPSKTADIEQSLVIGAHGARSLTVYVVEHWD